MFNFSRNARKAAIGMGIAIVTIAGAAQAQACCAHGYRGGGGMAWGSAGAGLAAGIGLALIAQAAAAPRAPVLPTGYAYGEDHHTGRSLGKVYFNNGSEVVIRNDGKPPRVQRTNRPPKFMGRYRNLPDGGRIDRFVDRNTGQTYLQMTNANGTKVAVNGSMNGIPFR